MEAQVEMPRYRSHKTVWALKIKAIQQTPADTPIDGGSWRLTPEDTRYAPFDVPHSYYLKHQPQEGGYYVQYADGYKSFSPAEAFEDGYTSEEAQRSRLTVPVGQHRFSSAINELNERILIFECNGPIHAQEGNGDQAELCAHNAASCRAAIRQLEAASVVVDPVVGVSLTTLMAKIDKVDYSVLQDGRTTICLLTMKNGCTVVGQSVSAPTTEFSEQLGRQYAYDDALAKAWPLEVYLLEERKHLEAA